MKIFYIPFNRKVIGYLFFALVVMGILLFFLLNNSRDISVFGILAPQPIYKGDEGAAKVSFACNVVWGTEYIPSMLDILRDQNISITFFIGGEWAEENHELLHRMVKEGHELGNHGYYHKHHSQLSLDDNKQEIDETEKIIHRITGIKTMLFAPPYGEFNNTTLEAAHDLGYKTIMWSIDTIDWRREGPEIIAGRVLKDPHNGAIILMHPVEDTVNALPQIIHELKNRGFDIGRVSDVLENREETEG